MKEKNDYIKKTLSNGIKVYLYPDKDLKRTFVSYNTNFGSNGYYNKFYYDDKLYNIKFGMAHFLEHTLIEHAKDGNMLHYFMDKDYDFNGVTFMELTSFYFIGVDDIKKSIEKLIKMVDEPAFTKEDVETVKNAVCDELRSTGDNKYNTAYCCNKRNLYNNYEATPKCYNAIGDTESTKAITYDDVKLVYDAYYNNENKFLVIGGNFDVDDMLEYLEEIYKSIPDHPKKMREFKYSDDFSIRKEREAIKKENENIFSIISFKFKDDSGLPILVSNYYLSMMCNNKFNSSSKFSTRLMDEGLLLSGMSYSCDYFKGAIVLSIDGDVKDEEKFFEEVKTEIKKDTLTKEEFELEKKNFIVKELSKYDYKYSCFQSFAYTLPFTDHFDNIEDIKKLTFEEYKKYISTLSFDLVSRTYIEPKKN